MKEGKMKEIILLVFWLDNYTTTQEFQTMKECEKAKAEISAILSLSQERVIQVEQKDMRCIPVLAKE